MTVVPSRPVRPSPWIVRFASLIPDRGTVLDLACGHGRHARWLLGRGHRVVMVDRDISGVADLAAVPEAEVMACDLEDGQPWPLGRRTFDGVVVTNYLYRPIFDSLVGAVAPGGALLYETFADGNAAFGRPRNPEFLLRREELLDRIRPVLRVVAFEDVTVREPRPAAVQRVAAINPESRAPRRDAVQASRP